MDEALTFFLRFILFFLVDEASVTVNEKMKQTQKTKQTQTDHETSLSLDANDH